MYLYKQGKVAHPLKRERETVSFFSFFVLFGMGPPLDLGTVKTIVTGPNGPFEGALRNGPKGPILAALG